MLRVDAALNFYDDRKSSYQYEYLSIWLTFREAGLADDIAVIYIVHDDTELHWVIDRDSWSRISDDSSEILLPRLRMNDFSALGRGHYRVVAQSFNGDESSRDFFISPRFRLESHSSPRLASESFETSFLLNYMFGVDDNHYPYGVQNFNNNVPLTGELRNLYNFIYLYTPLERDGGYVAGPY